MNHSSALQNNSLDRISNFLMVNACCIMPIGLSSGRIGVVFYFYYLFRYTKNQNYKDFADSLFESVLEDIDHRTAYELNNGLIGVGIGMTYLMNESFLDKVNSTCLKQLDELIYTEALNSADVLDESFVDKCVYIQNRRAAYTSTNLRNIKSLFLKRFFANPISYATTSGQRLSLKLLMVGLFWEVHVNDTTRELFINTLKQMATLIEEANLKSSFYQMVSIINYIQQFSTNNSKPLDRIKKDFLNSIASFTPQETITTLLNDTFDKVIYSFRIPVSNVFESNLIKQDYINFFNESVRGDQLANCGLKGLAGLGITMLQQIGYD